MFGIKVPCNMRFHVLVGEPNLTAAISNAGGMVTLQRGTIKTANELRNAIRRD